MRQVLIFLLLLGLFSSSANAQQLLMGGILHLEKETETEAKNTERVDTNIVVPRLDSALFTVDWHTHITHVDSIDLSRSTDTFHINLVDDLHPHFALPIRGAVRDSFRWRTAYRHHNGMDIKLYTGDTVVSAFDGVVRYAQYNRGGYGRLVIIRHFNGLETYYAHFSKILVDSNQRVVAGQPIALGGSTGRSSGPHLHFEMRYLGNAFDPSVCIDWECEGLNDTELMVHKELFKHKEEAGQRIYYRVRSGDSLSRIARKYGTSVRNLCRLNGIRSTSIIRIGQRLRVR